MRYLILLVEWEDEELKWQVLHYSHSFQDAEKWYERYRKDYANVKLMIDLHEFQNHDAKMQLREALVKYKQSRCETRRYNCDKPNVSNIGK